MSRWKSVPSLGLILQVLQRSFGSMDQFIGLKCNKPHLSKLINDLMNHTWCAIQRNLCNQEIHKDPAEKNRTSMWQPSETQGQHSLEEKATQFVFWILIYNRKAFIQKKLKVDRQLENICNFWLTHQAQENKHCGKKHAIGNIKQFMKPTWLGIWSVFPLNFTYPVHNGTRYCSYKL